MCLVEATIGLSDTYNRTGSLLCVRHMAGCGARFEWAPPALPETDATVRPVLKHGPRSSTGLQVAARQVRVAQRKRLRLVGRLSFLRGRTTGQLSIRAGLIRHVPLPSRVVD